MLRPARFALPWFVAALAAVADAQDRGLQIAEALRRNDRATATTIAAAEPDLARAALFEAALQPIRLRASAFLSVAQRFPRHDVCGEALLAGCSVALLLQGRWPGDLPPLPELVEHLGDEWWFGPRDERVAADLAVVVPPLLAAVRQWEGDRPGAPDLALLQRLARLCACPLVWAEPVPVESGVAWPLPQPLGEDLLVQVRRLGDEELSPLQLVDVLARESTRRWLVPAREGLAELPSPGDGRWLLEVQSIAAPWRALRVVDVTSLRAAVLADQGVLVFAANDGRSRDDDVAWSVWRDETRLPLALRGTSGVLPLPPEHHGTMRVLARSGDARARVPVWVRAERAEPRDLAVAHWQCDRPLHRPGETVQGRVVVRTVVWQGTGLAAVPTTAPVAVATVPFVGIWPDGTRYVQQVAFDALGVAPFTLAVPAAMSPGRVRVELGPLPNGATLATELTELAAFRRPAVLAELSGPDRVADVDGTAFVRLQVNWASGGPAAVPVEVAVGPERVWSRERRRLATGPDGTLRVPIDVRDHGGERLECTCSVHGPDGFVETLQHTFAVDAPAPLRVEPAKPVHAVAVAIVGDVVVGRPLTLALRGPAYSSALVVLGRGRNARVAWGEIGSDCRGELSIDVLATDWPRLDVAVLGADGEPERTSAAVRHAQPRALALDVPPSALPGTLARCAATTEPGSVVTFAVVDERVFRVRADRTQVPDEALRPHVPVPQWTLARSAEPLDPELVFGSMLVDGRVPGPGDLPVVGGPAAGGAAGASSPAAGAGALRSDFRATACFRTVVADANGRAALEFLLPDDVTTWRVTASAIDARGEGTLATATFATRLALAAELQLPRVLRVGDRVEVPLLLDRAADAVGDDAVRFAVTADGAGHCAGSSTGAQSVARGAVATVAVPLVGAEVGDLVVRSEAAQAANLDRAERRVPVLDDAVVANVATAAAGRGVVEVLAPAERQADGSLQVEVLAGGAAAWRLLAARLQEYPYGCVEQTLSRLLPFAAGTAVAGDVTQRADRIGKGMARLRQLQGGSGGAFAWWPGEAIDPAMTGLVLHGLAALRAGGIDAAAYGLRIDVPDLVAMVGRLANGPADERAELVAGLLRFAPAEAELRRLAAEFVTAGSVLPRGTVLRLGLGLAAAGDRELAARCRQGLPAPEHSGSGFPGADPTVCRAHELELDRALGVPIEPGRELALVQELLAAACRTYTDAVALVALAPALTFGGADLTVEVAVDGGAGVALVLPAADGLSAVHRCGDGGRVVVRSADVRQLLFVRVATATRRPGCGPGWATPLRVERRVAGPGVVREEAGWITLQAGERVQVTVRVGSPVAARYVAMVCPLPAGCELLGDADHVQRFDDRVVTAWSMLARNGSRTCTFAMVPTLVGEFAWPSAVVEGMYEPGLGGGSDGIRVRVVPRVAEASPAAVPPFLVRKPVPAVAVVAPTANVGEPSPAPSLAEQLRNAAEAIDEAWFAEVQKGGIYGFEAAPEGASRARLDAALALLERHAADAGRLVLQSLEVPIVTPGRQRGAALAPWRRELLGRLWLLQERCLDAAVAHCERHVAGEADVDGLVRTVRSLPAARAEAVAARILTSVWPGDPAAAAAVVEALPQVVRDERLLGQLRTMLASGQGPADDLVARLPMELVESLPPGVLAGLLAQVDDAGAGKMVGAMCRSSAGRRALRGHLAGAAEADRPDPEHWPDDVCAGLPIAAFGVLADHDAARATALLATSDVTTATLWRCLQHRGDGVPLAVLVGALQARQAVPSADELAASAADPTVTLLLATFVATQDPVRLGTVLAAARPFLADGAEVEDIVRGRVATLVAMHGDVAAVRSYAAWLQPEDWRRVWARLDARAAVELVRAEVAIGYGLPTGDDTLEALLQRSAPAHEVGDAVVAIGGCADGFARLLAVRSRLAPELRDAVDGAMADELGFDAMHGVARSDAAACVVDFARHHGFAGIWPAPLGPARAALLTLCGLR
jgi:hypothetical protein